MPINMDANTLKKRYIDAEDLYKISGPVRELIVSTWVHCKNKHTKKGFYVRPPSINNKENMLFELLKAACEGQPETYEEKIIREFNIK